MAACGLNAAVKVTPAQREAILASVSLEDRAKYFGLSCCPITPHVEEEMEQISSIVSHESYADVWESGHYKCAQCSRVLYSSDGKFVGPCVWPSFREPAQSDALFENPVAEYNNYTCLVREVYCGGCKLFLGHMFEDGKDTGDTSPAAHWRHCVLSLSLVFAPATTTEAS